MQSPATQRCPPGQAAPSPQAQLPSVPQWSARIGSQTAQRAPSTPQLVVARGLHTEPEQQPSGQLVASQLPQTPPLHASPAAQALQVSPPVPQAPPLSPGWQMSPSQQPSGHDVESQVQAPSMHRWPASQAGPPPHPSVHTEGPAPAAEQDQPGSTVQVAEHPSPPSVPPSSHASISGAISTVSADGGRAETHREGDHLSGHEVHLTCTAPYDLASAQPVDASDEARAAERVGQEHHHALTVGRQRLRRVGTCHGRERVHPVRRAREAELVELHGVGDVDLHAGQPGLHRRRAAQGEREGQCEDEAPGIEVAHRVSIVPSEPDGSVGD